MAGHRNIETFLFPFDHVNSGPYGHEFFFVKVGAPRLTYPAACALFRLDGQDLLHVEAESIGHYITCGGHKIYVSGSAKPQLRKVLVE